MCSGRRRSRKESVVAAMEASRCWPTQSDHCEPFGASEQGLGPVGFVPWTPSRLNRPVTETARDTSYRLAPALGARLVGRSLVTLGVLVVIATFVGLLTGAGW